MHVHVRVCFHDCICKDHRPPHQMLHNRLTPINSGAAVVLFNSPLAAWQLLFSAPSHSTAVYPVTLPSPHTQSLMRSSKHSIVLHISRTTAVHLAVLILDVDNYQDLGPFEI